MNDRDASAALEMTPEFSSFVEKGVPSVKEQEEKVELKSAKPSHSQARDVDESHQAEGRRERRSQGRHRERQQPKRNSASNAGVESLQYQRVLSKARVQRSVRLKPDNVAAVADYLLQQELEGNERSFQSVVDEALEMWLRKHAG